jgi:hypothetical protein
LGPKHVVLIAKANVIEEINSYIIGGKLCVSKVEYSNATGCLNTRITTTSVYIRRNFTLAYVERRATAASVERNASTSSYMGRNDNSSGYVGQLASHYSETFVTKRHDIRARGTEH